LNRIVADFVDGRTSAAGFVPTHYRRIPHKVLVGSIHEKEQTACVNSCINVEVIEAVVDKTSFRKLHRRLVRTPWWKKWIESFSSFSNLRSPESERFVIVVFEGISDDGNRPAGAVVHPRAGT
jgi:hypothetical protein